MEKKTNTTKKRIVSKEAHLEFRHSFLPRQIKIAIYIDVFMFVYYLITFLLIDIWDFVGRLTDKRECLYGMAVSAFLFALLMIGKRVNYKTDLKRDNFYERAGVLQTLGYLSWAYIVLDDSVKARRDISYLPILMVYTLCTFFVLYGIYHYMFFFFVCCAVTFVETHIYPFEYFDIKIIIEIVIFGLMLTVGGITRYLISARKYFVDQERIALTKNLEENLEELSAANDELENVTKELRQKSEVQKLFTAGMSHELRSPLNGIIGLLQVLEEDKKLDVEEAETVNKALSSSVTLINIVNDLLDYYKLEAGEFNIISVPFDLRDVVDSILASMVPQAEQKDLKLEIDVSDKMPCMFKADGLRIQQIIVNLVSNGIKYTDEGFVKLSFAYSDGYLKASVKDSGQGIAKDAQEALFDPFKRFNENKNKYIQGTGLGLSIVKKLTEQMNGTITLESEVGLGSVFTVNIPVELIDGSVHYGDERVIVEKVVEKIDLTGRNILCIDDNKVNLAVFKGLLKDTGVNLKLLGSGKECLEEITKNKYDIIFLDHLMPEMDGVETFENMKRFEHLNSATPVVMLTANAGAEAEQRYMDTGFNGYLAKPVLRPDLYALITNLL